MAAVSLELGAKLLSHVGDNATLDESAGQPPFLGRHGSRYVRSSFPRSSSGSLAKFTAIRRAWSTSWWRSGGSEPRPGS
jgi:hypothetical protein